MIKKCFRVCVVGSGPGGLGIALALQQQQMKLGNHYQILVHVYEKDASFHSRKQGYGLTIQQGQRALDVFNLSNELELRDTPSSSHYMFNSSGELLGFFGPKFHGKKRNNKKKQKRHNVHTPRQELRRLLMDQLNENTIQWNQRFTSYREMPQTNEVEVSFDTGRVERYNLLIGCDGIFSNVRKQYFVNKPNDCLHYLGVLVVLGIVHCEHPLVQGRIWQTLDGTTRLFAMPFTEKGPYSDEDTIMWQLSFPMDEERAIFLSKNPHEMRKELERRCGEWHEPVPQMLRDTKDGLFSGTPVYDREPLEPNDLKKSSFVTLLGDAAHPMSPFKGQGANQALLDALQLSQLLIQDMNGNTDDDEKTTHLFTNALDKYADIMCIRAKIKVLASRKLVKRNHEPFTVDTLIKRGVNIDHVEHLRKNNINPNTPMIDDTVCTLLNEIKANNA